MFVMFGGFLWMGWCCCHVQWGEHDMNEQNHYWHQKQCCVRIADVESVMNVVTDRVLDILRGSLMCTTAMESALFRNHKGYQITNGGNQSLHPISILNLEF